jgi:hypothetical protein
MTIRMAPRVELTSDHLSILVSRGLCVDRSHGSIRAVLAGGLEDRPGGTKVPPLDFAGFHSRASTCYFFAGDIRAGNSRSCGGTGH